MMLLGTLDLGYRSYVGSVVQGTLHEAARMATVGGRKVVAARRARGRKRLSA